MVFRFIVALLLAMSQPLGSARAGSAPPGRNNFAPNKGDASSRRRPSPPPGAGPNGGRPQPTGAPGSARGGPPSNRGPPPPGQGGGRAYAQGMAPSAAPGPADGHRKAALDQNRPEEADMKKVRLREWITAIANEEGGLLDILADGIAPLCGLDPDKQPGKLREVTDVSAALDTIGFQAKAVSAICHAASLAAARLETQNEKAFSVSQLTDAHTKKIVEGALEKEKTATMKAKEVKPSERQKLEETQERMARDGPYHGARHLLNPETGLHPSMWGVSKAQFQIFLEEVRSWLDSGRINNTTPEGHKDNPKHRFEDPNYGPTMRQVNQWLVRLGTKSAVPFPGISWALKLNMQRGGLKCSLVIAHAWDDCIFEFGKRALAAWPPDCEGAFISLLSLPQNWECCPLIPRHPMETMKGMPLSRVLYETDPKPEALVVVSTSDTTPFSRLWIGCEALLASRAGIRSVTAEGSTADLIRGLPMAEVIQQAEAKVAAARQAHTTASMAQMEVSTNAGNDSKKMRHAEDKVKECARQLEEATKAMNRAQLDVLCGHSRDILDMDAATCTSPTDRATIKNYFQQTNVDLCHDLIAAIVRKSLCGVNVATKDVRVVPGALGHLSLDETNVKFAGKEQEMTQPPRVMHLAKYLWSRPQMVTLDLSSCQMMQPEVPRIVCHALAAGMVPNIETLNLDGCLLPVRQLQGADPVEVIDMSNQRLGIGSALAISALIVANQTAKALNLSSNALRDEGVVSIAKSLRNNPNCALVSLDLSNTKCGVAGAKELALTVSKLKCLSKLDISQNRICGVWMDQYGNQGTWSSEAVDALSDAIKASGTLSVLNCGGNRIRDDGMRAILGALKDDPEMVTLNLSNNEIGITGAKDLATAVANMPSLEELDLGGNLLCGAGAIGGKAPLQYSADGIVSIIEATCVSKNLKRLSLANNRICGVWSDSFGSQQYGTYNQRGAEVVADLMRSGGAGKWTLTDLDISANNIGSHGGKVLYEALREQETCPLMSLDVRHSRMDAHTEKYLTEIAEQRRLIIKTEKLQ